MEKENEKLYEIWKERLEEQQRYIDEVRAIKHDMQAHMIVLQYYLDEGMYEEAKRYLKYLRDALHVEGGQVEVDTGNYLINAIIEDYIKRNKQIKWHCDANLTNEIGIAAYDVCILVSNLISNACEACQKLKTVSKSISIKMIEHNGVLEIIVKNPKEWELDKDILGKRSTKEDATRHGYGIKNIKGIVEKYEGTVEFEILESIFCVKIKILAKEVKK